MTAQNFLFKKKVTGILVILVFIIISKICFSSLELSFEDLGGMSNLITLFDEAWPPDKSMLEISIVALLETFQIAFLGTVIGFIFSLPLGMLAARNLSPKFLVIFFRGVLALIRTLPALLWAVIFVVAVGLGALPGVLATAMYTIGYLGRLMFETLESVDPSPAEALKAMGASRFTIATLAVLPQAFGQLIGQGLFLFEYNVRASAVLGFVGAGGVGFYLRGFLQRFEYDKLLTLILVVWVSVMLLDALSAWLRGKFLTTEL